MNELKRTDLSVRHERAVLVGVLLPGRKMNVRRPLDELESLAETAGAIVVDGLIQKMTRVNSSTYLGSGKAKELALRAEANEADIIIFDNDLTPAQIRNLERITSRKVVDRSELILDIFASRARTHEARLQVELAQLEYTAPRLRGMWTHLERVAGAGGATGAGMVGGIGTRGPGERQIEIDRRIVRTRVAYLRDQIDRIDKRKEREVQSRRDEFTISLVGYTNSGKSTLMNVLTETRQLAENRLFATLDTKTARWHLGEGRSALLSDTVGFVRDLPHRLVASFRATLEETIHADLLLHVVDASSEDALARMDAVAEVLDELGCKDRPAITLLNKMDLAEDESLARIIENRAASAVRLSALKGTGLDDLRHAVLNVMESRAIHATIRVPMNEGKLWSSLDKLATVLARRYENNYMECDVSISRTNLNQLQGRHPSLVVVDGE